MGAMSRSPVTKFFTNKKFGCISLWISEVHAWNFISPSLVLFMFVRKKINPKRLSHKTTELFSSYIVIYIYTYSWCAGQMPSSLFLFLPSLNLYAKVHFNFRSICSLKAEKLAILLTWHQLEDENFYPHLYESFKFHTRHTCEAQSANWIILLLFFWVLFYFIFIGLIYIYIYIYINY